VPSDLLEHRDGVALGAAPATAAGHGQATDGSCAVPADGAFGAPAANARAFGGRHPTGGWFGAPAATGGFGKELSPLPSGLEQHTKSGTSHRMERSKGSLHLALPLHAPPFSSFIHVHSFVTRNRESKSMLLWLLSAFGRSNIFKDLKKMQSSCGVKMLLCCLFSFVAARPKMGWSGSGRVASCSPSNIS